MFFSKTVTPTNKSYKIGTPKVGVALRDGHIILGGCVTNFPEIAKNTHKMAKNQLFMGRIPCVLLWIVYTSTEWVRSNTQPNSGTHRVHWVWILCSQTHGMLLQGAEGGWNEEDGITHLLIMAQRFEIWIKLIKQTPLGWGRSMRWAHFQLPVGCTTYQKSVFRVFLENGKSYK